jgi:TATA-box binding protein (TBP) (component of TFIID and TFIIIB)
MELKSNINQYMDLPYKISTITMSMQIPDVNLNLMNIGKYMDIDDEIIGIKYNCGKISILKGTYSTSIYKKSKVKNVNKINTKLFYNQASIIVKFEERLINVKLFGNGSLHLTGVKDTTDGKNVIFILYKKLLQLTKKYDNILLTLDSNNIYIDNNDNIYSRDSMNRTIIGFKYLNNNEIVYNIHKKEYIIDKKTGVFISKKFESKRTRTLLDLNGQKIGYTKIELLKNKKKLYKNNCNINFDYTNGFIYYDNDNKSNIIGKFIYEFTDNNYKLSQQEVHEQEIHNQEVLQDILEHNYNCTPFSIDSKIYSLEKLSTFSNEKFQYDINCINIYLKLDFELNRQRLFNELIKRNYIVEYKPEKYSGVKLRYKIPKGNEISKGTEILKDNNIDMGICKCINKCICNNITFLIFQSGNIISTGYKSIEEIQKIVNNFNNIMTDLIPIIKKRILIT